jgi:hypothetical protein
MCHRSARPRRKTRATASSTCVLALISRPCSSHVYQETPTPASSATSSRRSPGVRRRGPPGMPKSAGDSRARRARRKLPSSARRRSDGVGAGAVSGSCATTQYLLSPGPPESGDAIALARHPR